MTSTIDNINNNIYNKIRILRYILNIYDVSGIDVKNSVNELDKLNDLYDFKSVEIFKNYYQMEIKDLDKQMYYNKFLKLLDTENIISKLNKISNNCKRLRKSSIDNKNIEQAYVELDNIPIDDINILEISSNVCQCKNSFIIRSKTSESVCNKCGLTEKLYGVVFDDSQFFFQEGHRTKHGKYDPGKHCKFWIDRIQAKESTEIPELLINKIISCIKADGIWLHDVTCVIIRDYLKYLKKTTYNDHVPLIRKLITGVEPPQFTDKEHKLINMYFSRVIQIYNKTKPTSKPNCPYHPFFIYKIVEQILNKPEDKKRRQEILSNVHMQSRETVIINDIIWEPICNEIPEFVYIPTIIL